MIWYLFILLVDIPVPIDYILPQEYDFKPLWTNDYHELTDKLLSVIRIDTNIVLIQKTGVIWNNINNWLIIQCNQLWNYLYYNKC